MTGLAAAVRSMQSKPTPANILRVAWLVLRQRRLIELLYGAWCRLANRPSPVVNRPIPDIAEAFTQILKGRALATSVTGVEAKSHYGGLIPADAFPDDIRVRSPAILFHEKGVVTGEYGEGKRLFFSLLGRGTSVCRFYYSDPSVRHIHAIHDLGNGWLAICTGDAAKYLDLWHLQGPRPVFVRRILRRFGGFTASAKVGGDHYFETDFTGRPNYLYRFRDGKKFFFPELCFTHFTVNMVSAQGRYCIGVTKELDALGGSWAYFVFDAEEEVFVEAGPIDPFSFRVAFRGGRDVEA